MTDPVRQAAPGLTHLRADGTAQMVDVSTKPVTAREASAAGRVVLSAEAVTALRAGTVPKGDALAVARIAGLQAVKRTPSRWPTRSRSTLQPSTSRSRTAGSRSGPRSGRPTGPVSRWKP